MERLETLKEVERVLANSPNEMAYLQVQKNILEEKLKLKRVEIENKKEELLRQTQKLKKAEGVF